MAKKYKFNKTPKTSFLQDINWYIRYTPNEMKFIIKRDGLFCVCFLPNTPPHAATYFHTNKIYYA